MVHGSWLKAHCSWPTWRLQWYTFFGPEAHLDHIFSMARFFEPEAHLDHIFSMARFFEPEDHLDHILCVSFVWLVFFACLLFGPFFDCLERFR
jgi:hypothetical protein